MRSLTISLFASLSLTASLLGCSTDDVVDELAGETAEDEALDGKADAAVDGSYTYFAIRGDVRRCAYPMCGGFFLERAGSRRLCSLGKDKTRFSFGRNPDEKLRCLHHLLAPVARGEFRRR